MKLKVNRYLFDKNFTMGKLYIDDILICDTLEDTYRGDNLTNTKIYGKTCIPCGTYEIKLTQSPRFKTILPELLKVPFFTGIRIHSGNTAEHTDGCILVGRKEKDGLISNSKDTLRYVLNALTAARNDKITIEIKIGYY
jgi:hypothetical protein